MYSDLNKHEILLHIEGARVNRLITENDLRDNGFSEKEIALLRDNINRSGFEGVTFVKIIDDLRKRFWSGMLFLLIIFVIFIIWCQDFSNYSYPVMIFAVSLGIHFFTPLIMGYKALRMYNKLSKS